MKTIRIHEHGNETKVLIDDISEPTPKENEVKIKIKATALNHMDLWVRDGIPGIGELPLILGCDGVGVVDSVGQNVSSFKPNDQVVIHPVFSCGACEMCEQGLDNHCAKMRLLGEHMNGTHAEWVVMPEKNVLLKPKNISFEAAAAYPLVYLTAWHMLVYNALVKEGETVLIMGASSGVGSAAIQIAKLKKAKVIATVGSDEKAKLAQSLGADEVINHYQDDIVTKVKEITNRKGVSVVFEHVGEKVWATCLKCLGWNGRLVTCGATTGPKVSMDLRHVFIKQQRIIGSTMGSLADMKAITKHMETGELKPVVGKVFSYQEVQKAHQYLQKSEHFGKVVLKW